MRALPRLMVAPNGARRTKSDHPALPVTIREIVACSVACHAAGADGIHAHVRDAAGQHVLDAGLYRELLAELARAVPGMLAQVTTEAVGRYSPADQRRLVEVLRPPAVSVALREMAAESDEGLTRGFYHAAAEAGIALQHILYDADDVARLADLVARKVIPAGRLQLLHVLGRYGSPRMPATADLDAALARQRAAGLAADWAVCAFGAGETGLLCEAVARGGKARVGFENNLLAADGSVAPDNAARVAELALRLGQGP